MDTLLDILKSLYREGYVEDFNQPKLLEELQQHTEDYRIDKVYRYEGLSDPEDEAVVFALSSNRNSRNGILVNGFGIYADDTITNILTKLKQNERNI